MIRSGNRAVEGEEKTAISITKRAMAAAAVVLMSAATTAVAIAAAQGGTSSPEPDTRALLGEAREGGVTVALEAPLAGVTVTEARVPGRPIVVLDPGHGGRDPGASGVSGTSTEKGLALALARELRDHLAERGRIRVALTREDDRYLSLEQRAAIARRLGAAAYISLHMDSAPNPLARGATFYSLSEVASDTQAAQLAEAENRTAGAVSSAADGSVRALLADLAERTQMKASAELAERLVRKSSGRFLLRPNPHRFASFHVLRRAEVPAVLIEAGYISNAEDEALLLVPEQRRAMVAALAEAIEADVASRLSR